MDVAFIFASAMALLFMLVAFFSFRALLKTKSQLARLELERAVEHSRSESLEELRSQLEEAFAARIIAEKQVVEEQSKTKHVLEQMQMREKTIEEMKQAAKASVMEAGAHMSTKLLEDHKREVEAAKKESERLAQKTTQELMENFGKLTQSVTAIQTREQQTSKQVETVMRALTNPAGAGQMSELALENSLKNLGLEAGRDFIMQYHVAAEGGTRLRPDVVIFLPQDMVMVIDSKASQFLTKLAEAEGTEHEQAVMQQFVASTRQHIDALARKQYADEVAAMLKKQGRGMGLMFSAMYLNSDAAIEKLRAADAGLLEQCEKAGIFLVGPAGLSACFSIARQQIAAAKRDDNQQEIIHQLRLLMGNLVTTLGHVDGMGKNIQMAAKKFGEFAKSMNRSVLPKLRQMEAMGVHPDKNKSLPQSIAYYDVAEHASVVEGDVQEVAAPLQLGEKLSA